MKKLLLTTGLIALIACNMPVEKIKPIEKYKGQVIVKIEHNNGITDISHVILKTKDSIYWEKLLTFDLQTYKEGDTIR